MLKHSPDLMHSPARVKIHKLGKNQQQLSDEFMVLGLGKMKVQTNQELEGSKIFHNSCWYMHCRETDFTQRSE